jgi:hypothetical protein
MSEAFRGNWDIFHMKSANNERDEEYLGDSLNWSWLSQDRFNAEASC